MSGCNLVLDLCKNGCTQYISSKCSQARSFIWRWTKPFLKFLDVKLQLFFDKLDALNSLVFFRVKWIQILPPVFVDFFYEGYRVPWLGVFTGFFVIHALLFSIGRDPILPTLSVEQCKTRFYVSNPTCENAISRWHIATQVESFYDWQDELILPWWFLSLVGAVLVGMANSLFHLPWWIFLAFFIEYLVAGVYLDDLPYCPSFDGSFKYNPIINTTTYDEEINTYSPGDANEFYRLSECSLVDDMTTAVTNVFKATMQANLCICQYYPDCCNLSDNLSTTSLVSAYWCLQSMNGRLPAESTSVLGYGVSTEVLEFVLQSEDEEILNTGTQEKIENSFDTLFELGKWMDGLLCLADEVDIISAMTTAIEEGSKAIECFCGSYSECCGYTTSNMSIPIWNREIDAMVTMYSDSNITVLERWNCSSFCLASALKTQHDNLMFQPWLFWFNPLFVVLVVVRFLLILWLFIRVVDKLFRRFMKSFCRPCCWNIPERRKKLEWFKNLEVNPHFHPISSRFMTSQLLVFSVVLWFQIISWYIVFFIMNCVIYEEIPTPFAGFTYSYTFNFGRAFKQYHWAVYLGGTILLLCINTIFFGAYWMLIVGYQMLKRDVEYVISRSEGDTQFALKLTDEQEEITNFLLEIESSEDGVDANAKKGTDDNAKKSGKAEAKTATELGLSSLDKFWVMPPANSAEKATDDEPHLTKTFSMYAKDDYFHVDEKFSKEEIDKFNICSAVKSIFFPFQNRQLTSRTIYEDCLVVNPFQASAFPAIYIVFTITGLAILLAVVIIAFVALLILILNLALLSPLFPDGYPLTRSWLIETVLLFFGIYAVALIANRYLMPKEGEWKQRIKCYQGVVLLDMIYLLTWGMLKAWAILATIMGVDILAWGFGRMAIWQPALRPPFQLFDAKYAAYVATVRAAMIAHHAKKNPRILLSTTTIQRQVASTLELVTSDASNGSNTISKQIKL